MKSRNILKVVLLLIVCIFSYIFIIFSNRLLWFYEYNNTIYLYLLPILLPINIYLLRTKNKFNIIFTIINSLFLVAEIINTIRGILELGGGTCIAYWYLVIITYVLISNILNFKKEGSLTNDLLLCIISFIIIVIHMRYYLDNSFLHNLLNITDINNGVLQNSYSYVTGYYSYFIIMFGVVLINQEIDSIKNDEIKRN